MYIHLCIYLSIYTHTHAPTHTRTDTHTHTYIYIDIYTCIHSSDHRQGHDRQTVASVDERETDARKTPGQVCYKKKKAGIRKKKKYGYRGCLFKMLHVFWCVLECALTEAGCSVGSMKALLRLYEGSIKAL